MAIDQRLPTGADPFRQEQFIPAVDEEGAVDVLLDVFRSTFAKHDFVGALTVVSIGQSERSFSAPCEVWPERHFSEGVVVR